ncbi:MAG: FGGY-family carbohydrate kinase [Trueperaceae bacterium]|nr:FGGY-family carbohydrate kinase [Trueperaceae bacterium]
MSEGLLLGIDVGTYSSKGVLVTPAGEVVRQEMVEHGMDVPKAGWAEHDAEGVWWHDVVALCRRLLDGERYRGSDVVGVAVSAIGPCLLALDEADRPLRPAILYGVDTRAQAEIAELTDAIGAEEVLSFSKTAFTSQAIGPKIVWLKRHEPEVWARTARLTTASSYLVFRLTGEHVMDRHTASHWMPLIDMERMAWSERYAEHVAPTSMLPNLAWSDERAGVVTQAAADETGLAAGTPVAVGAVDALSEALSVGVAAPGDLMIMYGSTAFFILVLERPLADPRVWMTGGAFDGQYALAAGMATTGSLTRWIRDAFAKDLPSEGAYQALFDAAAGVPPGSEGLLMLPYFSGERTPINDPNARGVLAGLTLAHGRPHVFRAALEGVAHGIRHNLEVFEELGAPIERLVAVGGGVQGGLWPQIVSDVTGRTQHVPERTIGASYGDAFLAGLASGTLDRTDLNSWVRGGTTVHPQPDAAARYDQDHPLFRRLYQDTRDTVHALAHRGN